MNSVLINETYDERPKEISNRKVEETEIIAVVTDCCDTSLSLKKPAFILPVSAETPKFFINICQSYYGGQILFEIRCEVGRARLISCKVLILDKMRKWQDCGQGSALCTENKRMETYRYCCEFPFTLDFHTLMYGSKFGQNNLTLKCQVIYFELASTEYPAKIGHKLDSSQRLRTSISIQNPPLYKKVKKPQSSLVDDLISLYMEGTLCDMTLRTESENFKAHKTILSARSPVFKTMFTSDMKERALNYVDISDINADTLRRFLVYIYTDTLSDMEWQDAMELYFAADKYQIDSLKSKCSTFLKSKVQSSNCLDLLLLSDMHQDVDLKHFVQGYIIRRDQDIFGSDEWRNFMASHVQLAADTMYCRYARK